LGVVLTVAIPFRVGWGFQLSKAEPAKAKAENGSQSLSGWDGVFDCS